MGSQIKNYYHPSSFYIVCQICFSLLFFSFSLSLFIFVFFLFNKLFFLPQLPTSRYGRVQSVKIITSGTNATTESSDHHLSSSTTHHHHLHHLSKSHNTNNIVSNCVSPANVGCTESQKSNGATVGVTSCSSVSNNVSSSNQSSSGGNNNNSSSGSGSITICATIAFMDIKSASKAHLAEHKFDDRILTTEYYEPSAMQHGSSEGNGSSSNLVINNKMMSESSDTKQELGHGRYASTSSHGLVWHNLITFL